MQFISRMATLSPFLTPRESSRLAKRLARRSNSRHVSSRRYLPPEEDSIRLYSRQGNGVVGLQRGVDFHQCNLVRFDTRVLLKQVGNHHIVFLPCGAQIEHCHDYTAGWKCCQCKQGALRAVQRETVSNRGRSARCTAVPAETKRMDVQAPSCLCKTPPWHGLGGGGRNGMFATDRTGIGVP